MPLLSLADLNPVEELALPSREGVFVRVQRPNIVAIIREGNVPDLLSPLVEEWIKPSGQQGGTGNIEVVARLLRQIPTAAPLLDMVVAATVVEPKLTEAQAAALSLQDRWSVFSWALGREFGGVASMFQGLTLQTAGAKGVAAIPTMGEDA